MLKKNFEIKKLERKVFFNKSKEKVAIKKTNKGAIFNFFFQLQ
jgi:hypothetical protein